MDVSSGISKQWTIERLTLQTILRLALVLIASINVRFISMPRRGSTHCDEAQKLLERHLISPVHAVRSIRMVNQRNTNIVVGVVSSSVAECLVGTISTTLIEAKVLIAE